MLFYSPESSEGYLRLVEVRLLGTGAAAPTKQLGQGITVTRTGVGVYRLTFAENLGTWRGPIGAPGLEATTMSAMADHSVVFGAYTPATRTVDLTFYNAAGAARDLAALEFLNFTLRFKQRSV